MKYSDEAVEKLIDYLATDDNLGFCPSEVGLYDANNGKCIGISCKRCWQQALTGDD